MADPARPALRVLGLFAGIGGLELGVKAGLRDVGLDARLVGLVEGEAFGAAVLARAMREGRMAAAPIWLGDVREFPAAEFGGAVDLVVAGFPCQPASTAGKRRGTADDRWLWPQVVRVARETGCRYLFLENVPGLLTVNDGEGWAEILRDLAALGFAAEWTCLRASDVGAPHRRERVFLLGRRDVGDAAGDLGRTGERGAEAGPRPDGERGRGLAGADGRLADADGWPCDWPPGPDDRESWGRILAADPSLAPALENAGRSERRENDAEGSNADRDDAAGQEAGRSRERCEDVGLVRRAERLAEEHGLDFEPCNEDFGGPRWHVGFECMSHVGLRDWIAAVESEDLADGDGGRRETERSGGLLDREPQPRDDPHRRGGRTGERGQEPASLADVRRVDDELSARLDAAMSHRLDRLRALGNAVVPPQAAAAFAHLWRRLHPW